MAKGSLELPGRLILTICFVWITPLIDGRRHQHHPTITPMAQTMFRMPYPCGSSQSGTLGVVRDSMAASCSGTALGIAHGFLSSPGGKIRVDRSVV